MEINPAASRYTEAKLEKIADEFLKDIEKETVDMQLNYDETIEEPKVLPTRVPNLLPQRILRNCGWNGNKHPSSQSR